MTAPSDKGPGLVPALPGEVEVYAILERFEDAIVDLMDDPNMSGTSWSAIRKGARAAILAALAAAYTKGADENAKWECPKCGLTMWAGHTNADGSLTCPTCDDLPAALAQREAETVERCARVAEAVLHPADASKWDNERMQQVTRAHGRTIAEAIRIRALAGDGGKATPTEKCSTCGGPLMRCECCTTAGFDTPNAAPATEGKP